MASLAFGCSAGGGEGHKVGPDTSDRGDDPSNDDPLGTGGGGGIDLEGSGGGLNPGGPSSCDEAASNRTYVGCEFWPTVTYNPVYPVFDFAAVVANGGAEPAEVVVEQGGAELARVTVDPGNLEKIVLPWVDALKGGHFDGATVGGRPTGSIRVDGGAYRLTSTVPITAWQFNPLQYKKPASDCTFPPSIANGSGTDCNSVSNDAALLLPTSALTGTYRVIGATGFNRGAGPLATQENTPGAWAITATADGTTVDLQLGAGDVLAGSGVDAASSGGTLSFTLDAGDVVQLLAGQGDMQWGNAYADLSGSLISASHPVQVIATVPITAYPSPNIRDVCCADHLEETVIPAEVLGTRYVVPQPTTVSGAPAGHYVRFFGNFDGTTLTYGGTTPSGAPTSLDAAEVVEVGPVNAGFEVEGSASFAVGSVLTGGQEAGSFDGDPAFSLLVAVPQYRTDYVFLAPDDYDVSYADVLVPDGADVTIDGSPLTGASEAVAPGWSIVRETLDAGTGGVHVIESTDPVGLQVTGFGHATGYYYPGGLNLELISEPPVIR